MLRKYFITFILSWLFLLLSFVLIKGGISSLESSDMLLITFLALILMSKANWK